MRVGYCCPGGIIVVNVVAFPFVCTVADVGGVAVGMYFACASASGGSCCSRFCCAVVACVANVSPLVPVIAAVVVV